MDNYQNPKEGKTYISPRLKAFGDSDKKIRIASKIIDSPDSYAFAKTKYIIFMIIAAFCLYYLTTNSPKEIEQIVEKGSGNKPLMENNTKEVDTIGLINMFLTIIMIAFIPIGGLLILFSILYAQKLSEKQQKDLRTYGWVIIIISLLMFSTVGD